MYQGGVNPALPMMRAMNANVQLLALALSGLTEVHGHAITIPWQTQSRCIACQDVDRKGSHDAIQILVFFCCGDATARWLRFATAMPRDVRSVRKPNALL